MKNMREGAGEDLFPSKHRVTKLKFYLLRLLDDEIKLLDLHVYLRLLGDEIKRLDLHI